MKITKNRWSFPLICGSLVTLVLLIKNFVLYAVYTYAFYPDSRLYITLGASFFKTGYISPLVTFPFIFLNALTGSSNTPVFLLGLQMLISAISGGVLCAVIARKDKLLAILLGILFGIDLVWGAFSRNILTDGLFAAFNIFSLAILVRHYDHRDQISVLELLLSGVFYGWTLFYRPSNVFLVILIPFVYFWLTRSWKKTTTITCGLILFFLIAGSINWKGSGKFYILASGNSYTGSQIAFPLLVYRLYSPENGPASQQIQKALQACFPGKDYITSVDRGDSGTFDSANNMTLINNYIIPCIDQNPAPSHQGSVLFPTAYIESFTSHPLQFVLTILREDAVFLRYNNPYILHMLLSPSQNYGCADITWCEQIQDGRLDWDGTSQAANLYEKTATKLIQAYLWPVGLISRITPDPQITPYWIAWLGLGLFLLFASRGRTRFLFLASFILIQYTSLVVVAGLGFTERYAAMLSPIQGVLSAITYALLIRLVWSKVPYLKRLQGQSQT